MGTLSNAQQGVQAAHHGNRRDSGYNHTPDFFKCCGERYRGSNGDLTFIVQYVKIGEIKGVPRGSIQ